jgi:hypothetical protein
MIKTIREQIVDRKITLCEIKTLKCFSFVFLCSKEHFSIIFLQYLDVTAGIELAI